MKRKSLIIIPIVLALGVSGIFGYKYYQHNTENVNGIEEVKGDTFSKLEGYDEVGLQLLKNNFTTTDDMEFALKNIGTNVSDLKFLDTNSKTFKFKTMKGKKFIIEIAQSSCESCKLADPIVKEIMKDYQDVEIIPIFLNSTKESINAYYDELKLDKPNIVLIDEVKKSKEIFSLKLTPTYLFVDETGTISMVREGFVDENFFIEDLKTAYADKKIYEYQK